MTNPTSRIDPATHAARSLRLFLFKLDYFLLHQIDRLLFLERHVRILAFQDFPGLHSISFSRVPSIHLQYSIHSVRASPSLLLLALVGVQVIRYRRVVAQ